MTIDALGGAKLFVTCQGDGAPIIMLHGNRQDSSSFHFQTEFLSKTFKIISLDSRGHGQSTHGSLPLTLDLMAQDVITVADALKLSTFSMIGFSDGANIALKVLGKPTHQIDKVVLISPNISPNQLKFYLRLPLQILYLMMKPFQKSLWIRRQSDLLSLMIHDQAFSNLQLEKLSPPALILSGRNDIIHSHHIREISDLFITAKLVWISHAGHFILNRKQAVINPLIKEFLET